MDRIYKEYKENKLSFDELETVEKMPENRPDGTENEEEIEKYIYTKGQVDEEKKHLKKLYSSIKREGFNFDVKTFVIGHCDDKKNTKGEPRYFLMDGQHCRAVLRRLISEGQLPKDIKVKYELVHYSSYEKMAKAVNEHNAGRNMNNVDKSRNDDFTTNGGKCFIKYKRVVDKVNNELPESLIRICMYGQHNGEGVFHKPINEFYEEIINAFLELKEKCANKGLTTDVTNQIYGATHGATSIRDFYARIFSTLFVEKGETTSKESLLHCGRELCGIFSDALLGEFSPASKNYTPQSIKTLCMGSQKAFKATFKNYVADGTIKFYKRTSPTNEENSDFLKRCMNKW